MKYTVFLSCIMLQILSVQLSAQVPQLINYQARLTDPVTHNPLADGGYEVTFSIYDAATGGTALWTETQTVQTTNGVFSVLLGSVSPVDASLFSGTSRYLGLAVGSDPEMTPRLQMVSVPFALQAKTAETLTGDAVWQSNNDNLYYNNGYVGIGTSDPAKTLHVSGEGLFEGNGKVSVGNNSIFFQDSGRISSFDADDYHSILFRREEDILEFREFGDIVFSSGAMDAIPTNNMVLKADGNLELNNRNIRNLADPADAQDAATKAYVDANGGSAEETDPTWKGNADTTGNIGRIGNVGIGTTTPVALLHTHGTGTGQGNVLFTGKYKSPSPGDPPASGAGTRMMWYPDKAAFRVGYVNGPDWDKDSIGLFSVAMGYNTKAKRSYSTAMGSATTASGSYSTAMGSSTTASETSSTAMGSSTTASGPYSTAMGYYTTASGQYSTAMGLYSTASGPYSTVMGYYTTASGQNSTAMGLFSTASGYYSTAMGYHTTASGSYSTAMGDGAEAVGNHSFAINLSGTTGPNVGASTFRISGAAAIGGNLAWINYSDQRLKKDIQKLNTENNLAKIMQMDGVRFRWKDNDALLNLGFVAQDVKDLIPESVRYDELNDIYSMEYTAIIPVLVEGIKEMYKVIEAQQSEIKLLQQKIDKLTVE